MKKIIIDCDPGFDDSIALLLAYGSKMFDIRLITTCAGNQTLEKISKNALKVLEHLDIDDNVYMGAEKPLMKALEVAEDVHGESGLKSDILVSDPKKSPEKNGILKMYQEIMSSEEKVTIIATGPLTNVALLVSSFPDVLAKIQCITLMGGGIHKGNVTKYAEFNIYTDPEAAYIVYNCGAKINMLGLDVTHKALINGDVIDRIRKIETKGSKLFIDIYNNNKEFYEKHTNLPGVPVHDACAVAFEIDRGLFEVEELNVDIEVKDIERIAMTKIVDRKKDQTVSVSMDIDFEKFVNYLCEALENLN